MVWGKVAAYKHQMQLTNPKFVIVEDDKAKPFDYFGGGVYPAGSGLSARQIKGVIEPVLKQLPELINEFYDSDFRKQAQLIPREQAFNWIHTPPDENKLKKARRRLKYDELFLMQLGLALRRYRMRNFSSAVAMKNTDKIDGRIRKRFPFLLTGDQDKVISEIAEDLSRAKPMNRLLQGDVGSGKTVVALYAALLAVAVKSQLIF